jgi:hypothetical protein
MGLFEKSEVNEVNNYNVNLTPEEAQHIYSLLKQGKDDTRLFIEDNILFQSTKLVKDEIKRLETEALELTRGKVITPAVYEPSGDGGTPQLIAEEVRCEGIVQEEVEGFLSSDILNIHTLVSDVVMFAPNFNPERTWEEFRSEVIL